VLVIDTPLYSAADDTKLTDGCLFADRRALGDADEIDHFRHVAKRAEQPLQNHINQWDSPLCRAL
jgi:hypothetical protein